MNRVRSSRLQKLTHFLTAFTVIMKGVVKMEEAEKSWPTIVFLFAAGAFILVMTLLHERLHHHAKWLEALTYLTEAFVVALVAALYVRSGARGLPYVLMIASAGFVVAFFMRIVKKEAASG